MVPPETSVQAPCDGVRDGFRGQLHGTCVERGGAGILLLGASGAGKSELALRLVRNGFTLVADDRIDIEDGWARAPAALAGLLEVRGVGIVRLHHTRAARPVLAVEVGGVSPRLPTPRRHAQLDLPVVTVAADAAAPDRVALAFACALGHISQVAGAFAP